MAEVQTIDVTTLEGSDKFPVNINDVYGLIETIASQNIRALRSTNRIVDGFYDYDVENGKVIEEAVIAMAKAQTLMSTVETTVNAAVKPKACRKVESWNTEI